MKGIVSVWNFCVDYVMKYRRYFAAGLVGVGMIGMLAVGTSPQVNPLAGAYSAYEDQTQNEELTKLFNDYYKAYDNNDVDGLKAVAEPFTDRELSYIAKMSEYIDSHTIEEIYTKRGADEDSLVVSVKAAIKYNSLDQAAPGLDFFYVEKKGDKYVINNAYSLYNLQNSELDVDDTITSLIAVFEAQDDVVALQNEVQKEHEKLMLENAEYNAFFTKTIRDVITEWATAYDAEAAQKKAEEEAKKAEEEAAKAAEKAAQEEEANKTTVRVTAKVNVREAADGNSNPLGQVAEGAEVTKYAEEGEWSKIDFNGTKGYVKTEFLAPIDAAVEAPAEAEEAEQTEEPAQEEQEEEQQQEQNEPAADTNSSVSAGQTVMVTSTVNVREGMDENSPKVAVAYAGAKVGIVMPYSNGWTKVTYDGKTGYIKSELLK